MKLETLQRKINQTEARLALVTKYSPKSKIAKVQRLLDRLNQQLEEMQSPSLSWEQEIERVQNKADALTQEFAALEPNFIGSPKQQRWAGYIFSNAVKSMALSVASGNLDEQKAVNTLSKESASWWIDNRHEWQ